MKKPAIPPINTTDRTLNLALAAIRENIELITGARTGSSQVNQLATNATNDEIIAKVNEIIGKLNYSGQ